MGGKYGLTSADDHRPYACKAKTCKEEAIMLKTALPERTPQLKAYRKAAAEDNNFIKPCLKFAYEIPADYGTAPEKRKDYCCI